MTPDCEGCGAEDAGEEAEGAAEEYAEGDADGAVVPLSGGEDAPCDDSGAGGAKVL